MCFEEHDDVVRFIDIDSTSSFADFHKIIQESIGFDGSKDYSFFMSNHIWRVENKICGSETTEAENLKAPKETKLNRYINDPHQRFVYLFDPELIWSFNIELVRLMKAEPHKKYPLLARKEGEAPKQNKLKGKIPGAVASNNEYDKMAEMLMASRLMDELAKEEDEDIDEVDDIDIEKIDVPELLIPTVESKAAEIPKIIKPLSFDLKFDDEDLKIDADDLDLLEGEEGEMIDDDEKEEEEDNIGLDDYGSYNSTDDNNDDY